MTLILLQAVCALSVAVAAVVCLYHVVLAIVAAFTRHRTELRSDSPVHSFAIVVPAHNEESTVHIALDSCRLLDYPREKYAVYVVADNCTDQTAEVTRAHGAICLERQDPSQRGKGFALEWAIPRILADGKDAVVILDADCTMESHALRVFDQSLKSGDKVLQANYVVANPDASVISYVLALGGFVANVLFHAPKSALGLPVLLIGSGMVFHREILDRFPWQAQSLCEDTEYALLLQRQGIASRFVSDVRVASDFPMSRDQFVVQRRRWIRGGMHAAWNHGLKLIWKGLRHRQLQLIDAGFTSVILSRPLILAQLFFTVILSLLCRWLVPDVLADGLLLTTGAVIVLYVLYSAFGICLLGLSRRRIGLLLRSPWVVLQYLALTTTTLLMSRTGAWDRTPRAGHPRKV